MVLTKTTRIGLTIGQAISGIFLLFSIFGIYLALIIRVNATELKMIQVEKDILDMRKAIIDNRDERVNQLKQLHDENESAHKALLDGQNKIYDYLLSKKA